MMKRRALWSIALLGGLATSLLSARHACGQTTTVYYPPVYRTTYYAPRVAYYPAYRTYRPTFFQAFFGPLAGYNYNPAYYYRPAYYPVQTRSSYYVPTAVGYAPVISSSGDCTTCSPCGTNHEGSSSASGKKVPVPDGGASKSAPEGPRTYSGRKPPLPAAKSTSPDKDKPAKAAKKTDGVPRGDSDFKPTRPKNKSGDSPAFPGPDTGDTGNARKVEARKLAPPVVIQQRKGKRPPVTEPAGSETDPFDRKTTKPGTTDKKKSQEPTASAPGKKPAASGSTRTAPTAGVRPLHLDGRVARRTVSRRTRLAVRSARLDTPSVDRAYRSNRGWIPVPSGHRVVGTE